MDGRVFSKCKFELSSLKRREKCQEKTKELQAQDPFLTYYY